MYAITVHKTFSAAHTLDIGGERESLHGHNFKVEVTVTSEELNPDGIVMDFRILKRWLEAIIEEMDHTCLNDLDPFKNINPTAERIARLISERLNEQAVPPGLAVSRVAVWESEGSKAVYTPPGRPVS